MDDNYSQFREAILGSRGIRIVERRAEKARRSQVGIPVKPANQTLLEAVTPALTQTIVNRRKADDTVQEITYSQSCPFVACPPPPVQHHPREITPSVLACLLTTWSRHSHSGYCSFRLFPRIRRFASWRTSSGSEEEASVKYVFPESCVNIDASSVRVGKRASEIRDDVLQWHLSRFEEGVREVSKIFGNYSVIK